jgi:hypothetical protein
MDETAGLPGDELYLKASNICGSGYEFDGSRPAIS